MFFCFSKLATLKPKTMKYLIILLIISSYTSIYYSQNYSRVKIFGTSIELKKLSDLGVTIDHGSYKQETFFISDFSEEEIDIIKKYGFQYEIMIADVKKHYKTILNSKGNENIIKNNICSGSNPSNGNPVITPTNFNNGSMGGYLTYTEMLSELDDMAQLYPNLITVKAPIHTFVTHENRPVYHVKISDNPNTNENETNVLYSAIHHAREPMSLMETIFFMWYLLENYATNDEVKFLVDNNQMFFVPCINPDGYIYNEITDPNGGGMWRKNRRNNGNNYGVDLNRNYSYGWGTTGTTTTNTNSDTYCGPSPFSEPETQAMQWLVEEYEFVSAFNAHAYMGAILFPIGTTVAEYADHHDYFQDLGNEMVVENGYSAIKSSGLYPASGDSDDYMYKDDIGVGMKDTIFAYTPEVGTAFWQPQGEIESTCANMVYSNMVLSHMPHKYLVVNETDPSTIATTSGNFNHDVQRLGLENGVVDVSIEPILNVQTVGNSVSYNINLRETASGTISYTLNPSIQFGDEIKYILKTDNGSWVKKDTIIKTYGAIALQIVEDANNTTNWTGNWSTTNATYVSPSKSFTDSPNGNYNNNSTKTMMYSSDIDLSNASSAMASFYAKWDIEADYDYTQFQVSTDNGNTWIGQCGNYTVPGTNANGSVQPNNEPVYEGTQATWVLEEISLSDYLGQIIKVRFILEADGGVKEDGFYFDDFKIFYNNGSGNQAPVANFTVNSSSICLGDVVSFTDFSNNIPNSWNWNFGDGVTSTDQNPTHIYTSPGTYSVSLVVSNSVGNDSYQYNYIYVHAIPNVTLSSNLSNDTVCLYGDPVNLTVTPSNSNINGAGVSNGSFNPSIAGPGSHTITATYQDSNSCTGTAVINIYVDECLSINSVNADLIKVIPNPNNGSFAIKGLKNGEKYSIYDINGKAIYYGSHHANTAIINPDGIISNGIYYLRVHNEKNFIQVKFIVYK